jgi:hypothetical protein
MYPIALEIHSFISWMTWIFFLLLGLWGIYRGWQQQSVDGSYLGAMIIGQSLFIIQAVIGLILYVEGGRPIRGNFHFLYGVFALVFLPGLFAYLRGDDSHRAQWVYGLGCLFLFGIALRAIGTG